jgi:hypothetical protein
MDAAGVGATSFKSALASLSGEGGLGLAGNCCFCNALVSPNGSIARGLYYRSRCSSLMSHLRRIARRIADVLRSRGNFL